MKFVVTVVLKRVTWMDMLNPFMKEKTFKCNICDYSCPQKGYMNTHVASVHNGKKQFKCDICGYSCSQKSHMNRHVASVYEGKKPFKCDICDCSFSSKQHMKQHVAKKHA